MPGRRRSPRRAPGRRAPAPPTRATVLATPAPAADVRSLDEGSQVGDEGPQRAAVGAAGRRRGVQARVAEACRAVCRGLDGRARSPAPRRGRRPTPRLAPGGAARGPRRRARPASVIVGGASHVRRRTGNRRGGRVPRQATPLGAHAPWYYAAPAFSSRWLTPEAGAHT